MENLQQYKQERMDSLIRTSNDMLTSLQHRIKKGELSSNQIIKAMDYLQALMVEIEVFNSDDFDSTFGGITDFDKRTSQLIIEFGTIVDIYEPKCVHYSEV